MKRTLMAASLVISLSTNFIPTQAGAVLLRAWTTCADWAKNDDFYSKFMLIGFLNGLSYSSNKEFWHNLEPDQAYFWMDRYCNNNPLSTVMEGAINLMNERSGTNLQWN